jgi:hypothetical protein
MPQEPWATRWEVVESIGGGGQGVTKKVRSRHDGAVAVLKVLKQQRDADRRGRMHRESEALRTLSHPGIPKLLDSNTSEFAGTTPLYMVIDLIDGPTLEKQVEHGVFTMPEAIALTVRLVEIVAYCHERSFGHRDIKPDNILMRGGSKQDPVLIDFGLSFNLDEEQPIGTATEQQIGNRFLALPELATPGSEKRDPRSDLASCCGIFYFAVSGHQPMTLRDGENKAPHERRDFARVLDALPERPRTLVSLLLGRGFMYTTDQRYQDAAELRADLEGILAAPTFPSGAERVRAAIEKGQLRNREVAMSRANRDDTLGEILKTFIGPICDVVRAQVQVRVANGVPIQEVAVDPQDWTGRAARIFNKRRTNVFHYRCKAPGTRGFDVVLQSDRSEYETEGTIRFMLLAEWSNQRLREAHYLLKPGGRWTRIGNPPADADATALVAGVLALIDDEELWSVPETRER